MNPSCTKERKFKKPMKSHINISSKQGMQKSKKIRNNPTSYTPIVMQIMTDIYLTDTQSHQYFIYSVVPSQIGVTKIQYETSRRSFNAETRTIYTGVLYPNWIKKFFRSIVYPIGPPSKLYEDNQTKIKSVLTDIITP